MLKKTFFIFFFCEIHLNMLKLFLKKNLSSGSAFTKCDTGVTLKMHYIICYTDVTLKMHVIICYTGVTLKTRAFDLLHRRNIHILVFGVYFKLGD